jgi:hypothetical protein
MGILIFKGLTARRLYKSFGVKGLKERLALGPVRLRKSVDNYLQEVSFMLQVFYELCSRGFTYQRRVQIDMTIWPSAV